MLNVWFYVPPNFRYGLPSACQMPIQEGPVIDPFQAFQNLYATRNTGQNRLVGYPMN